MAGPATSCEYKIGKLAGTVYMLKSIIFGLFAAAVSVLIASSMMLLDMRDSVTRNELKIAEVTKRSEKVEITLNIRSEYIRDLSNNKHRGEIQ